MATASEEQTGAIGITEEERRAALLECLDVFTKLWKDREHKEDNDRMDLVTALAHGADTKDLPPMAGRPFDSDSGASQRSRARSPWSSGASIGTPRVSKERLPEEPFADDCCTYVRLSGTYVLMAGRSTPRSAPTTRGTARTAILAATLRLVASEGVDAVTHRRVAELAGVSPGSTTHHFSGRDELLREAFRHYIDAGSDLFDALFDAAEQDKKVSLRVVRDVFVSLIEREFADPSLVRAEYELLLFASKDDELSGMVAGWEGRLAGALAAVLERAGARRPTEAARTLMNFVRGFELERLVKPKLGPGDFRRRLAPLLRALCEGGE